MNSKFQVWFVFDPIDACRSQGTIFWMKKKGPARSFCSQRMVLVGSSDGMEGGKGETESSSVCSGCLLETTDIGVLTL